MKIRDLFKKKNRWAEAEKIIDQQEAEKRAFNQKLQNLVYNYPTKHPQGFTSDEQMELAAQFPNINMDKYWDAQTGITCIRDDKTGKLIIYHYDVLTSLKCGIQNRNINVDEWD